MAGFRFLFPELVRETTAFRAVARRFLDPSTTWVLERFLSDLNSIGSSGGESIQTLQLQCLNTVPSRDYEAGHRRGGQDVHAVISGTWQLRPLGSSTAPGRKIEFCGIASTRIELYASDHQFLGMWRLELGGEDSPGCYIHAQILGDSNRPPFPKCLPIPRLPSIFVTPMSALEFVLGELFQDKWAKEIAGNKPDASYWRTLQQKRLQSLFSWYQRIIENSEPSPWMTLKAAHPDGYEFLQS